MNGLVSCPRCQRQVPTGPFCQNCGAQLGPPQQYTPRYYQPHKTVKPGVSLKIVLIAVGIVTGIILLGLLAARLNQNRQTRIATAPQTRPQSDKEVIAAIGDRVERGGIALTLLKTKKEKSISSIDTAESGNIYLVAEVLIENVSRDSTPYNPMYFKVKDWDGIEYRSTTMIDDGALHHGELFKGDRVRGKVAFKMKANAAGLVMTYEPFVILGGYEPIKIRMY